MGFPRGNGERLCAPVWLPPDPAVLGDEMGHIEIGDHVAVGDDEGVPHADMTRRERDRAPGVERLRVAVMGCVVNGPGESKHANIGISLPGSGENPVAPVYVDGEKTVTLKGSRIAEEFQALVESYVRSHYAPHAAAEGAQAHEMQHS